MKIAVAVKIVYDDADISANADGSLDYSKAHQTISTYDLNAIECAAQLKQAHEGSTLTALSVGPRIVDDSKLKKGILSRDVDDLLMVADDAADALDAHQTAALLAALAEQAGGFDLVICGDGSADNYAQQTDVQLASALGVPVVNAVTELAVEGSTVRASRLMEDEVQQVQLELPCVVSVTPDVALPRIPGMKEILAAGKKPMAVSDASAVGSIPASSLETLSIKAPEQVARRGEIYESTSDSDLDAFAAALKAALQ